MNLEQVLVAFHLIGFALGLGGATTSDIMFFTALRRRNLSAEHYDFLKTLSRIIWVGLGLLIVSGLAIFALIYFEQGSLPLLLSPRWQAKLTLVGIVLLNGLFFKFAIFPGFKAVVGRQLTQDNIGPMVWKLAISGTVSILSWYSILVVSLMPRTFRPPYLYFMGAYLILLAAGVVVSKTLIRKIIRRSA